MRSAPPASRRARAGATNAVSPGVVRHIKGTPTTLYCNTLATNGDGTVTIDYRADSDPHINLERRPAHERAGSVSKRIERRARPRGKSREWPASATARGCIKLLANVGRMARSPRATRARLGTRYRTSQTIAAAQVYGPDQASQPDAMKVSASRHRVDVCVERRHYGLHEAWPPRWCYPKKHSEGLATTNLTSAPHNPITADDSAQNPDKTHTPASAYARRLASFHTRLPHRRRARMPESTECCTWTRRSHTPTSCRPP